MSLLSPNDNLNFPKKENKVEAKWAPIYIEPIVGSGERISVGVVVVTKEDFLVVPVSSMNRLRCIYGEDIKALIFAAETSMKSIVQGIAKNGTNFVFDWKSPIDGVYLGNIKSTAGRNLEEIARYGLMLSASLVEKLSEEDETSQASEQFTTSRLEKMIKESVILQNPQLEIAFTRRFQPVKNARPTYIGFVGQKIAANFGLFVPGSLAAQVKDVKAKLWDLAQLQEYIGGNFEGLDKNLNRFELLLHKIKDNDPSYSDKQIISIKEAVTELEEEADKKKIRCRPLTSTEDIASILVEAEAA